MLIALILKKKTKTKNSPLYTMAILQKYPFGLLPVSQHTCKIRTCMGHEPELYEPLINNILNGKYLKKHSNTPTPHTHTTHTLVVVVSSSISCL